MTLPADVENIISVLESHGHEAYAVGGCVRDCILGKMPHNWDITTSAKPQEVKALFKKTFDTGIEHGTVTVVMHGENYEVTTYRVDGKYEDGRHPKQVTFTASLEEDLKRRDFTINAMAYNPSQGMVDLFGGMDDLQQGIIRAVGNPTERFSEDALRMLRAVRFAAQLNFTIEEETYRAIADRASTLDRISAERIQVELVKMICSENPGKIRDAYKTGLTAVFLPEFDVMMETEQNTVHHMYTVGEHTIHAMENINSDKDLRLTMLLHDVAKPKCRVCDDQGHDHFKGHPAEGALMARDILQRLKFDNNTIDTVEKLIKSHDERPELSKRNVRRLLVRIGEDSFDKLMQVKMADTLAQSTYQRQEKLDYIEGLKKLYQEIQDEGQCVSIRDMKINGRDIIAMGVPQSSKIGEIIKQLFDEILEDPSLNNREYLLQRAKELI